MKRPPSGASPDSRTSAKLREGVLPRVLMYRMRTLFLKAQAALRHMVRDIDAEQPNRECKPRDRILQMLVAKDDPRLAAERPAAGVGSCIRFHDDRGDRFDGIRSRDV